MNILDEINSFYYHMSLYELQLMNGGDYYHGLSYNSLLYLNVISQMSDCTASKISEILNVTKSAVTIKIKELVKQGAVIKVQSTDDKRIFYLRLSPQMEDTIRIYDQVFLIIGEKLKEKYTEDQLTLFNQILHTISGFEWRKLKDEE